MKTIKEVEYEEKIKELQERINKAIEYINTHNYPTNKGVFETDLDKRDLINILKGARIIC